MLYLFETLSISHPKKRNLKKIITDNVIYINKDKLSELVVRERRKLGISRQELIRRAAKSLSKSTINSIEFGKQEKYNEDTLMRIAKLLEFEFPAFLMKICDKWIEYIGPINIHKNYSNAEVIIDCHLNKPYSVHSPDDNDLYWIEVAEREIYNDVMPNDFKKLKSWFDKNPSTIKIVKDKSMLTCGYFTVLPVSEFVFDEFRRGEMYDNEITDEMIFSLEEKSKVNHIILLSLIAITPEFEMNIFALNVLIENIPNQISEMCNKNRNPIVFSFTGKNGDSKLLDSLKFERHKVPENSRTKLNLYITNKKKLFSHIKNFFK